MSEGFRRLDERVVHSGHIFDLVTARFESPEGELRLLGTFANAPGFSDELSWVYLGRDLEPVPRAVQGIEESHLVIERISFGQAREMIADGRLTDTKSIVGILLAAPMVDGE